MSGRVLVANEYNLRGNVGRHRDGHYARHLLFGVQVLEEAGWEVVYIGEGGGRFGSGPKRILRTNLRALLRGRRDDVVYATFTYGALLAGLARLVVGRPGRLITIIHGVPALLLRLPRLFGVLYRGHNALIFLSPSHHARLAPYLSPAQTAVWAPWGPSADWVRSVGQPDSSGTGAYALVIGKTKRDWATLVAAHRLRPFPLVVVGGADCPVPPGPSVTVHKPVPGQLEAVPLAQMQAIYRDAGVVVLPLVEDRSLNGSTALGEALASGTPIVMTATRAMEGFANIYQGWVHPVPVGNPAALADAVHHALRAGRPDERPSLPSAETFEAVLSRVLPPPGRLQ